NPVSAENVGIMPIKFVSNPSAQSADNELGDFHLGAPQYNVHLSKSDENRVHQFHLFFCTQSLYFVDHSSKMPDVVLNLPIMLSHHKAQADPQFVAIMPAVPADISTRTDFLIRFLSKTGSYVLADWQNSIMRQT